MRIAFPVLLVPALLFCALSCRQNAPEGDSGIHKVTRVILWGNDNTSHNKYRIPALIVSKDGTLLAFAEGRESDDDGKTWSVPMELTETCTVLSWGWNASGPGTGIQLKSEKYRNRLVIPANNSYNLDNEEEAVRAGFGYGSHVLLSGDGGETWSNSKLICRGPAAYSCLTLLPTGEVGIFLKGEKNQTAIWNLLPFHPVSCLNRVYLSTK